MAISTDGEHLLARPGRLLENSFKEMIKCLNLEIRLVGLRQTVS